MLEDFHLHHLCLGLRQRLTGRRVAGVQTAGATRLLIRWEGNAERCLVQLDPDRPTIRILAARARRDSDTWVNCPAIDDELAGRRLTDLEKVSDDRRVVLRFGDAGAILVAEVRPIAPSLHLCDAGGVVRYALGPLRTQLQPLGAPYREPVRAGRVPPEAGSIRELLAAGDGRDRRRALLGRVQRLSPLLLDEAQARAGVDEPDVLAAAVAMVVAEAYAPSAGAILYARQPWLPDEYRMDPRGTSASAPVRSGCAATGQRSGSNVLRMRRTDGSTMRRRTGDSSHDGMPLPGPWWRNSGSPRTGWRRWSGSWRGPMTPRRAGDTAN